MRASAASEHQLDRLVSPWREVVHIEMQTNSKGRDCYWLTLECGHHKYASIPGITMLPPMVRVDGPRPRTRTAPHKCRCLLCGAAGANASD